MLFGMFVPPANAQVVNLSPFFVGEEENGTAHAFGKDYERWSGATNLLFGGSVNGIETRGFRPIHVRLKEPASGKIRGHVIYPFIYYQKTPDPDRSHFGFLPIAGKVTSKFGKGRDRNICLQ